MQKGTYQDTMVVNSVPAGSYVLEWVNPSDGSVISQKTYQWSGGNLELISPEYSLDIAMRMHAN